MRRSIRLAALAFALAGSAARGAEGPRVGVLTPAGDAEAAETAAALIELVGGSAHAQFVERTVGPSETDTAAALAEMRVERVELIVAVGAAATSQVRNSARGLPVVFAGADPSESDDLRAGGNACVVAGPEPDLAAADLRRAAPTVKRIGVFVPAGDRAALANGRALAAKGESIVAEAAGDASDARAAAAVAKLLPGSDAIWLPPSVSAADASALAKAVAGRGVPLVGSRRAHLEAGCAIVVRSDARDVGAAAALLVRDVLAGADPGRAPVRRPRRRLLEVSLPAATRLDYRTPLTLLAWADSIVRGKAVMR